MSQTKATIIKVSGDKVSLGFSDGSFFSVSLSELDFTPTVGGEVFVFDDGKTKIISQVGVESSRIGETKLAAPSNQEIDARLESIVGEMVQTPDKRNIIIVLCLWGIGALGIVALVVIFSAELLSEDFCEFVDANLTFGQSLFIILAIACFSGICLGIGKEMAGIKDDGSID